MTTLCRCDDRDTTKDVWFHVRHHAAMCNRCMGVLPPTHSMQPKETHKEIVPLFKKYWIGKKKP